MEAEIIRKLKNTEELEQKEEEEQKEDQKKEDEDEEEEHQQLQPQRLRDIFFAAALYQKEDKLKKLLDSDRLTLEQIHAFARLTTSALDAVHSPLYMAAVTGNLACVKLLLPYSDLEQKGKHFLYDMEFPNMDGVTALWGAAATGQPGISTLSPGQRSQLQRRDKRQFS